MSDRLLDGGVADREAAFRDASERPPLFPEPRLVVVLGSGGRGVDVRGGGIRRQAGSDARRGRARRSRLLSG